MRSAESVLWKTISTVLLTDTMIVQNTPAIDGLLLGFTVRFPFLVGTDGFVLFDMDEDSCARIGGRAGLVGHESSPVSLCTAIERASEAMLAGKNHRGVASTSPGRL